MKLPNLSKMLIPDWFSYKTFTIYLKSGQSFDVKAKDFSLKRDTETGVVNSYQFSGMPRRTPYPIYIVPPEIVTVVCRPGIFG